MSHVIRRIFLLLLCTLALAACAADERNALSVGEHAVSEDGLTDLILAVDGEGSPDGELPTGLSAARVREVSDVVVRDLASVEYLETAGVVLSETQREEIKRELEAAISEGRLGPVARTSDGYEALTYNVWVASQREDLGTPEAQIAVAELMRNANISSRIGEMDPETSLLVPRG